MISYLKGRLLEASSEAVIVEAHGVGYEVVCNLATIADLQASAVTQVEFWIYTHVREDALQLFGFLTKIEKQFFLSLLRINGVGPKMALNIMSGGPLSHLQQLIESGDVKGLSKLPKVGKKTAEQMILALRGKLILTQDSQETVGPRQDILSALLNLGYRLGDVEFVVEKLPKEIGIEEGIRQSLVLLSKGL